MQPYLTAGDGHSQLPARLRVVNVAAIYGPELVRRGLARFLTGQLPEFIARYPDGRAFRVPAGDVNYDRVFFWGEYDRHEADALRRLLRPGDVVVDVGAHIGWYTVLLAATVAPRGQAQGAVIAFEPYEPSRRLLTANLALNPYVRVDLRPRALGAYPGEVTLYDFAGLPSGHVSTFDLGRDDAHRHTVPRSTLDSELDGARPALVKIDVEGSELDVLRGAAGTLSAPEAPIVFMEANAETTAGAGGGLADLAAELGRHDYQLYRVGHDGLVPESNAAAAHGVTWAAIPPGRRDRLSKGSTVEP